MNKGYVTCEINGRRYRFTNIMEDKRFNTYHGYCPKLKKYGTIHDRFIQFDDGTIQKCTRIFN